MLEQLLERVLEFLAQVLGGRVGREETIRALFLLLAAIATTLLSVFWRPLLLRIGLIRRLVDSRERRCGTFLQPIYCEAEGLRYTILTLRFSKRGEYYVKGTSYRPDGSYFASFESRYVVFHGDASVEFVCSGTENDLPVELRAFARIDFTHASSGDFTYGRGYAIDFTMPPRANRFRIERIEKQPTDLREFLSEYHERNGNQLLAEFRSEAAKIAGASVAVGGELH